MLTAVGIRNAKARGKPYKLFDGAGLYLEVTPNGARYWRLKYRFGGKEKRLALVDVFRRHAWEPSYHTVVPQALLDRTPYQRGVLCGPTARGPRLVGQIGISTLVQRLSGLQLAADTLEYRKHFIFRALLTLPISFQPAS